MHVVSFTLRLWALHSIQLPLPLLLFQPCSPSCFSSTTLRTVVTLRTSPKKEMSVLTSYFTTEQVRLQLEFFYDGKSSPKYSNPNYARNDSIGFSKRKTVREKPDAKSFGINSKSTPYSQTEKGVLPVASTKEPEEIEFVVESGACMHTVSKKDLNSDELNIMRTSRILRRFWRPTARRKPEKPRKMLKNWT